IAHANRVEVLNVDTGQKLGEITGMHGVHGIELIPELGKGYTSNGLDRTVTVFDRNTLRVLKLIRYTGVKPDAIQYDPDSRRLFVVNGGASGDVTIIDPSNDAIVDTLLGSMMVTSPLARSEEHTSELQSRVHLVCRL